MDCNLFLFRQSFTDGDMLGYNMGKQDFDTFCGQYTFAKHYVQLLLQFDPIVPNFCYRLTARYLCANCSDLTTLQHKCCFWSGNHFKNGPEIKFVANSWGRWCSNPNVKSSKIIDMQRYPHYLCETL